LVEKTIHRRSENHNFTKENHITNTGFGSKTKLSFADMRLSTFISSQNKDFSVKQLPSEIRYTFYRLRKEDQK
jgi:transcription initiation factor TFIIIB Brf1 subunit/transcription initiation factor TFIIB